MACLSPSLNRLVCWLVLEGFWALFCQLLRLGGKLRLFFFLSRDRDVGINSVKDSPSFASNVNVVRNVFKSCKMNPWRVDAGKKLFPIWWVFALISQSTALKLLWLETESALLFHKPYPNSDSPTEEQLLNPKGRVHCSDFTSPIHAMMQTFWILGYFTTLKKRSLLL